MRLVAFSLFLAAAAAQSTNPTEPPKKARIEGTVVSLTGDPIPRATLRLSGGAIPASQALTGITATADEAGKFAIENITPAANYRLSAQRVGYVNSQYGARSVNGPGAPLILAEGQTLKGLTIALTPQGTISGTITDRDNDPIQGANVAAVRIGYQRGVRALLLGATGKTDDKGEYRIANVAPGRYYVAVMDRPVQSMEKLIAGVADKSSAAEVNGATYYPNAADARGAVLVNVTPGTSLAGMDIRMRRSRIFSIRGKAVNSSTQAPVGGLLIRAAPKQDPSQPLDIMGQLALATTQSAADGTFELRNISVGEWTLTALGSIPVNGGTPSNLFGNVTVSVRDEDVSKIALPVGPGVSFLGTLRIEGGDFKTAFAAAQPDAISLALASAGTGSALLAGRPLVAMIDLGPGGGLYSAQAAEDGTFKMSLTAGPGQFGLYLTRLPETYYVKSVYLGRSDVTHSVLDFTSGAAGAIDILLGDKPAEVSGSVHSEKNESMTGVMVTLWTKQPELASSTNGIRTAYTDQNGGFQFKSLPPGDYYLAAWENADAEQLQNRDLLAMFSNDDFRIKLAEAAKQSMEAKLITMEKLAAAVAKLP